MIELVNLTKRFGSLLAVNGINLAIGNGEIFGFIGPNGAGKTTTIRMMGGTLSPSAGTVLIDGIDIGMDPVEAKRRIGFIPDRPFIYEKLTGMEFLRFTADLYNVKDGSFPDKAREILAVFSLREWADELIEAYSHGMKQRLTIAAALLHDPRVIIVDEPMVGLDPAGIRLVKGIFRNLASEGKSVFLSTHTLEIAEDLCSRIGIIREGNLIATGTMSDLKVAAGVREADLEAVFLRLTMERDLA